jgi:DNA-binding XRE family transcriptional regulator
MKVIRHLSPDPEARLINLTINGRIKANMSKLREIRESLLVSKAELARKAKVSPITITRIENGMPCRMETKRKILLALDLKLSEKNKIFGED